MLLNLSILFTTFAMYNLLLRSSLTKNAVLVALYMVGCFICSGLLYLLLDLSFLGLILIIVYVGAVVVLFVFVSMMLPLRLTTVNNTLFLTILSYFIWFLVLVTLMSNNYLSFEYFNFFDNRLELLQIFGLLLYTEKAWYFLVAAVLLTIAMIGAILLTQNTINLASKKEVINLQLNKNFVADISLYS